MVALNNRGLLWFNTGESDRAIEDFSAALRLDPERWAVYVNRSNVWVKLGKNDKAIDDCNKALSLNPHSAAALANRAHAWVNKGDYDRAILDCDEAINLDPTCAVAFANRGLAWWGKEELNKAAKDCEEAVRLSPNDAQIVFCWGRLKHHAQHDYYQARKAYEAAIRFNPGCTEALSQRAWLLSTCPDGKYRDGKTALESAKRACYLTDWKTPEYLTILAAAYAENGQFDEAVKWQEKALENPTYKEKNGNKVSQWLQGYREKKPYRDE